MLLLVLCVRFVVELRCDLSCGSFAYCRSSVFFVARLLPLLLAQLNPSGRRMDPHPGVGRRNGGHIEVNTQPPGISHQESEKMAVEQTSLF